METFILKKLLSFSLNAVSEYLGWMSLGPLEEGLWYTERIYAFNLSAFAQRGLPILT